VSRIAVIPAQDILSLGSEARFNSPGRPEGNWQWRLSDADVRRQGGGGLSDYLLELATLAGRAPQPGELPEKEGAPRG
jgi:4-alpha-glucanotransferase